MGINANAKSSSVTRSNFLLWGGLLLAMLLILCGLVFQNFTSIYRKNVALESAKHLVEINYQVKLYIEETIQNDWETVHSLAGILSGYGETDPVGMEIIRQEKEAWQLNDVYLYTENGDCVNPAGDIMQNDEASAIVYYARAQGSYMTIMDSTLIYTMPVDTRLSLNGSRVVAVSVVRDLNTFLDSMDFSSFGGAAYMYLTQDNGAVISHTTHESAVAVYNALMLIEDTATTHLLGEHDDRNLLTTHAVSADLLGEGAQKRYIIITSIDPDRLNLRLFYFVPEHIVNSTMESFSTYIVSLSLLLIALFAVVALVMFVVLFRASKRVFDSELLNREHMFDLLVQNTNNSFSLFSTEKEEPLFYSSNSEKMTGYPSMQLIEEGGALRFVPPNGGSSFGDINERLSKWNREGEFIADAVPRTVDGATRYVQTHLYPVENDPQEFVGIVQDVTEAHEHEEALKTALAMANSANEAKTRFLSNMSHDIRTPMNAIVNMTDFAIASADDPENHMDYLRTIRESSEHLLHLINDVLDMSRIESGQTLIAAEPFDVRRCVRDVCDIVKPLYTAKRQHVAFDVAGLPVGLVLGDRQKLSQILLNLVNNAIKFTPEEGDIRFIATALLSLREEYEVLQFTVADNGIGISKESRKRIFEPFVREDSNRVSGIEGTGLGLSICQSFVQAMGGAIRCESELGEGCTFIVELPFKKAEQTENAAAEADFDDSDVSFAGRRALLCEDNLINQRIARKLLEGAGFTVDAVQNGQEGLDNFRFSAPGYYDIIYMDIQMPVMDGCAATVAIRHCDHVQAGTIPIIAMTANVFVEDVEKSRAAGMNGHVGKPIDVHLLYSETMRVLKKRGEIK